MENTLGLLFQDKETKWYLANGESHQGPYQSRQIYQMLEDQEISWIHYIWNKTQGEWKRICDVEAFKAVADSRPKNMPTSVDVPSIKATRRESDIKEWFLYYSDQQSGPYSAAEVQGMLASGAIHANIFVWKEGLKNWEVMSQNQDWKEKIKQIKGLLEKLSAKKVMKENRVSPRAPLTARVLSTDQDQLSVALCRDISIGGMQVLTDIIPGEVGSVIKINVTPPEQLGVGLVPFVAQGVIVRLLEDQRGFSFRFEKLSEKAKKAIEAYIKVI